MTGKQPEEHTSHHYLIKIYKNTGNGGLKVLFWVPTTQSHSRKKLPIKFRRTRKAVKKREKNGLNCYLDTYNSRPARRLEDRKRSRACLKKELQLVDTLTAELWFHVTKHSSSTARVKNLTS
jgi:hypothetical protein